MSEQGLETSKPSAIVASHMGNGELEKVMQTSPKDMQSLFPAIASAV